MADNEFVDYYELLQLHPSADTETVERIFRHLAKKYHPDNGASADTARFQRIVDAHRTLSDPQTRASYDVKYQDYWNRKWKVASEASNKSGFGDDQLARERLLSLLYVQRRRSMSRPGMGEVEISRLLQLPAELVEFHLWYLKAKRWVERQDTGLLAITAEGVDQVEQNQVRLNPDRLLEGPGASVRRAEPGEMVDGGDQQRLAAE
ncbi:MAG TPA: DnaJ domain-containing protein [Geomonas sp.]|nr:DnaJ domain-containing protein [Geomonas sp.]